jgi:hypothetical protein
MQRVKGDCMVSPMGPQLWTGVLLIVLIIESTICNHQWPHARLLEFHPEYLTKTMGRNEQEGRQSAHPSSHFT